LSLTLPPWISPRTLPNPGGSWPGSRGHRETGNTSEPSPVWTTGRADYYLSAMVAFAPAQSLDADLGRPHRAEVRGVNVAFWRRGHGGVPLLLVHGWPSTRRIWVRNVAELAARGFDVIAPDLRGFGDSDCGPDGLHDVVAHSLDMATLLREQLGVDRAVAAGGDLGAAVIQDMSLRFPGLVDRLVVFNGPLPNIPGRMDRLQPRRWRLEESHGFRPATEPDALVAELSTPQARMAYVAEPYKTWSPDGTFADTDLLYLTEPFASPAKLRASFGTYESLVDPEKRTGRSMIRANDTPTLILEALSDPRVYSIFASRAATDPHPYPTFGQKAAVVFSRHVGPFSILGSGHFLQWEAADIFNDAITMFCADQLDASRWRARLAAEANEATPVHQDTA
jgi:pimeloyl-ACP methyl ester carboxylesterase